MKHSEKDAWERWLKGMRWDWWATPTFHYPKTQPEAVNAVREWLAAKGETAYAVIAYERGTLGGRLHVHAVIGGVGRHPMQRTHLERSWKRGIITLQLFDPTKRCLRYMLDAANDADAVEIIGNPLPFKPKRRRR